MSKKIILCADDYAQNRAISDGILALSAKQRINAISCLVNTPLWPELHHELKNYCTTNYLGLHLNLTSGQALSSLWQKHYGQQFTGLRELLKNCYLGQLHKQALEAEIQAQVDTFTETMGMRPDFIDGHQHIQQLPVIRDSLLSMHKKRKLTSFFRNTSNGLIDLVTPVGSPKKQVIALLGGLTFKKRLERLVIPTNASFAGIYNFVKAKNYRHYFTNFLAGSSHQGLIMCHPGMPSTDCSDPLKESRCYEMDYLMSDHFLHDLTRYSFQLASKPHRVQ